MKVAIHQPDYIPWPGYFYKIAKSDIFILLDDVQFSSGAGHNRRNIKTPQGLQRIQIPVSYNHGENINQVIMRDDLNWKSKHLRSLEMNYKKAKYFDDVFGFFEGIIKNMQDDNLAALNSKLIIEISKKLGFATKFETSSKLDVNTIREERIIDLVKKVGGTEYLSGQGAKAYQTEDNFTTAGLKLSYSDFKPRVYSQLWGGFEFNVTVLDYFFNHGFNWNDYIEYPEI
jgi:hypothetical protein